MTPQEFEEIFDTYVPNPQIPLRHCDPYTLLIAVLLSAQCTDARVNTVTPHLPQTPSAMVALSVPEIEAIIRPCGLAPTKARALWKLSQDLLDHHNGQVPRTLEELEELPGVGHKTASVVLVQAFGEPAFPVDTHIHRCAERWGLSNGRNVVQTEKDLKTFFPRSSWGKVHLQMILFARKFCPARAHSISDCPICARVSKPSAVLRTKSRASSTRPRSKRSTMHEPPNSK